MSPGAGQAMVALSTGHILLSLLVVCPNKTQRLVNLAVPHIREGGGIYPTPPPRLCILGTPRLGEAKERKPMDGTPPPRSPSRRTLGRVRSCVSGEGVETQPPPGEPLGVGRGRPGAQAPPPTPAGREGEAVARAQ